MEPAKPTSAPSTNPPSVEAAYKRKCIALKKRLGELEDENELMRVRNKRGWQYIQKMRLESCILLERLAESTGMGNELDISMGGPDAEYDKRLARATARMKYGNLAASGNGEPSYLGDETEGSSEEQPLTPQPQERPLRIKRPKKENEKDNEGQDEQGSTPGQQQPSASGDQQDSSRRPTQDEMTSSFRVQTGSNENENDNGNGNEEEAPSTAEKDETKNAHPTDGAAQEPASNGTAPEATDSQQQEQQEQQEQQDKKEQQEQDQPAPPQQSESAPVPEDNTTTPMDMDTTEEQKES